MMKKTDVAVIGGDTRQIFVANEFVGKNFPVYYYGEKNDLLDKKILPAKSLPELLHNCSVIICPVPFAKTKSDISGLEGIEELTIPTLLDHIEEKHTLFGGVLPEAVTARCDERGAAFFDIAKRSDFAMHNSVPTAEGAIISAITESKNCIQSGRCLVLGFGRCGKAIADRLRGFHAEVTVCSGNEEELCEAKAQGYKIFPLKNFNNACGFDFIFNTIPAPVVTRQILYTMQKDITVIDIASAPGGVDFEAAKELKINARLCLGIPGKFSPKSAGKIIAGVILKILEERSN